jgi:hypothetical protein
MTTSHDRRIAKLEGNMGIFETDVLVEIFGPEAAQRLQGDWASAERQQLLGAIDTELARRAGAEQ